MPEEKTEEQTLIDAALLIRKHLYSALYASRHDYVQSEDGKFHRLTNGQLQVPGETLEARRSFMVSRALQPLLEYLNEESAAAAGVPRDRIVRLLADPLASETRTARRNLLLAAVSAALVGITGEVPKKIPGLEFELGAYRTLVMELLLGVVLYQLVVFLVYAWGDSRKNLAIAREFAEKARLVTEAVKVVRERKGLLELCDGRYFADTLRQWLEAFEKDAPAEVARLELDRRPGVLRRWIDFLVPGIIAGVSVILLSVRIQEAWWFTPYALAIAAPTTVIFCYQGVRRWYFRRNPRFRAVGFRPVGKKQPKKQDPWAPENPS